MLRKIISLLILLVMAGCHSDSTIRFYGEFKDRRAKADEFVIGYQCPEGYVVTWKSTEDNGVYCTQIFQDNGE